MATVNAILTLRRRGWSFRRIARELGIHRDTVSRHVRLAEAASCQNGPRAKQATPPTGSEASKQATLPTGSSSQPSQCEPFREIILAKLEVGLSAQRIWQDLRADHGFAHGYDSVKRFVRRLGQARPLPFRRMECGPGEQAQIDFGTGAPVIRPDGRRRRTHIFRVVLSHSRKAHSEVCYRQTTDDFIRCIENAFWHFGGVPKTLVIDNLKAAVTKADWFDPDLNPKIQAFCEHYGTVILPTKPRMPRHKGKIENQVGYAKDNALKGRTFESLEAQNRHLLEWETSIADTRIHGTTRKQVCKHFREVEQRALQSLPVERFPFFHEAERTVHRDAHVEVDKAYYSVPPEYLGRKVWARWDGRMVRIFNHRMEQIAVHLKSEPGRFRTEPSHIAPEKISGVERGSAWLLDRVSLIGPYSSRWGEEMLQERGIQGVRVLLGLLSLSKRHSDEAIEKACQTASTHGAYRLRVIRELVKRQAPKQEQFEFIDTHPIIRSLSEYGELVRTAFSKEPSL
jgi:transposase